MKLKSNLVYLSVCAAFAASSAQADILTLDADLEDKNSMTWPMLPGESVNELAAKFYPSNKVMQQQFLAKTLVLNADSMPKLDPKAHFSVPTALLVPTLKSLSASTKAIKKAQQKPQKKGLQLSYNMKAALQNVPQALVDEYNQLLSRNAFLKEELTRIKEKIVVLQTKLQDLQLMLDKTLSLPQKKVFKNLDAQPAAAQDAPSQELPSQDVPDQAASNQDAASQNTQPQNTQPNKAPVNKPAHTVAIVPSNPPEPESPSLLSGLFDSMNKTLLFAALGLGLVALLASLLLKKYRDKMYQKFVIETLREPTQPNASKISADEEPEFDDEVTQNKPLGSDTQVDDLNERSILDEAKFLMSKDQPTEAIEHIKWALRAQPKSSIGLWLYLLEIFRQENLKEDFENYAKMLHQTFNVVTPMWVEKAVPLVMAQTLEEFEHIAEKLTATWPEEEARVYLRHLISDNRNGERTGFSKAVLDEILFLIAVFDARRELV